MPGLFVFQILKDDIAKHRALLQEAEDAGQKLIQGSNEDPAVVADIYSKLYKVRGVLDKLAAKVEQRQNRLENVLLRSQEFQVSFDDFLEKLARLEEQTARQEPVSGIYDTVKAQNQEHRVNARAWVVFVATGAVCGTAGKRFPAMRSPRF